MNDNPYEAPALSNEYAEAIKSAKQRVAPVARGLQWAGAFFAVIGGLGTVMAIVRIAKVGPVVLAAQGSNGLPPKVLAVEPNFFGQRSILLPALPSSCLSVAQPSTPANDCASSIHCVGRTRLAG